MNEKTAITVLQELTISVKSQTPAFDLVAQKEQLHGSSFEYECRALGATARGVALNKNDAKQEAAHLVLVELAQTGTAVPPYRESNNAASSGLEDEGDAWLPDMSVRPADYHTALTAHLDEDAKKRVRAVLQDSSEESVFGTLRAIGLEPIWEEIPVITGKLHVVDVVHSKAPFTVAGHGDCDEMARAQALKLAHTYLTALLK